jgi:hypothetical protein
MQGRFTKRSDWMPTTAMRRTSRLSPFLYLSTDRSLNVGRSLAAGQHAPELVHESSVTVPEAVVPVPEAATIGPESPASEPKDVIS